MKTIRSLNEEALLAELYHVIAERKSLEKRETELKDYFKALAGDERVLKAGDLLILFTEMERRTIDRKSLVADIGEERVRNHEKVTSYMKTEVKAG